MSNDATSVSTAKLAIQEILARCAAGDESARQELSELLAMIPVEAIAGMRVAVFEQTQMPSIGDLMAAVSRRPGPVFRLDESI